MTIDAGQDRLGIEFAPSARHGIYLALAVMIVVLTPVIVASQSRTSIPLGQLGLIALGFAVLVWVPMFWFYLVPWRVVRLAFSRSDDTLLVTVKGLARAETRHVVPLGAIKRISWRSWGAVYGRPSATFGSLAFLDASGATLVRLRFLTSGMRPEVNAMSSFLGLAKRAA